ncbi:hypothetical protein [Nocardia sp. alder85J]|uniref:hypothetical protein n=1 Tax=Nocardia sp. alder85J TaxID=2862949 RepID=UPI001CD67DD7|nr:hypothetical protein [Nocardia sp. alder85J]MCX4098042.1 hypothetical protein [Nocardia sp. alder85J]
MDSFRAVVIRESLLGEKLPADLPAIGAREYPHLLDEATPIHIIEFPVDQDAALNVAMQLAEALLPEKYYAHLVRDTDMLIAFPNTIVRLRVGDEPGERRVRAIGRTFAIPDEQMRFLEMFDVDHPDAPTLAAQ